MSLTRWILIQKMVSIHIFDHYQADCDIRDYGKKVHGFEIEFDETLDKLNKANEQFEEKDKLHKEVEGDIAALTRRIMLMEEEDKKAISI